MDQIHDTQYWMDEIDNSLLVISPHSQGEEYAAHYAWPHGSCTQERSEQPGVVGGRLRGVKRVWGPLVSTEGYSWSFE